MSSDLMAAVNEIREHADNYQLAADYYDGTVDEFSVSPAVQRALRGCVNGFDINLARRPVDAVLDRIQIQAITVPNDETGTRWLVDTIWNPNQMDRYSKQVHWGALTYGDAYLIVWPGDIDGSVELHYNSPVTTRMFYDPENLRVKAYAAKVWCVGSGDQKYIRVNLYYADRIEKWVTDPGHEGKEESEFRPWEIEGEPWPMDNPYGIVPVFHFRTAEPYGRPEHAGAFGPQNAITKLSNSLMATVDFQGFPQRYALTEAKSVDDLFASDPDDESAAPNEEASDLRAGPGRMWRLPGATKVGQFDPANVHAFLDPMASYTRWMSASTATPLRFFDPQGQIPSGEALRADDAPLAHRIHDREDFFSEEWVSSLMFAALVLDRRLPAVDVKWRPVQTTDDYQGWQTVILKMQAGVPFVQALTEAGYSSDLVEGWERDRIARGLPVPPVFIPTPPVVTPVPNEGSAT